MKASCISSISFRLLFLSAVLVTISSCDQARKSGYPSDSDHEAIEFFQSHKEDFEKLRVMIEATPIEFLDKDGKEIYPKSAFNRSPENEVEMLKLMSELHLRWINGTESSWGIRLVFLADGMVMAGTTKSFFYSKTKPKNIVSSIEGFSPSSPESSSVFMPIESDWYLQFEWGG